MIQSDTLFQQPNHITDEINNDDIIVLPNDIFIKMIDLELQDEIKNKTAKDDFFAKALQAVKDNGPLPIRSSLKEWKIEEEMLFFKDRCYISPHEELWWEVVKQYYDSLPGGHPGHFKPLELIWCYYWWPGMTVFVKSYVAGCAICQQIKINTHLSSSGLIPLKGQKDAKPFSQVTCDFITDLSESNGFDSLMVVVDHGSTKRVISIPCNKTIDATLTAQNYIDHVYWCFGLPDSFLSDCGPQFSSQVFREMAQLLGIKMLRSTSYHPQTNRETERVNQELKIYFWIFCSNNPKTWKLLNSFMEFSHNQKVHSTTKQTLFYLMMGYKSKDIPLVFDRTNTPTVEQQVKTLHKARNEAAAAYELVRQKMAERSTWGFTPFKKGEQVWLDSQNLKIGYQSQKLAPKWEGPFIITEVLGPITYCLKLLNQWQIYDIFYMSLLSPYYETETHGPNFMKPPPDLIKGKEEYEIEVITSHKKWGRGYQYLVKWKGYPISNNTWESASGFKNAQEILTEYQLTHHLLWSPLTSKPHPPPCPSHPQTTELPLPSPPDLL